MNLTARSILFGRFDGNTTQAVAYCFRTADNTANIKLAEEYIQLAGLIRDLANSVEF
jgi:hypothetical protein